MQRRDHVMNFVAILFEGVQGSDLVIGFQLPLCQVDLLVSQFCQRARFADRVGLMLVFRQILGQTVLRGERSAERQRRDQHRSEF